MILSLFVEMDLKSANPYHRYDTGCFAVISEIQKLVVFFIPAICKNT